MWWRRKKKCSCNDDQCRRFVEVMPSGRMIQHNMFTCGNFKKQLEKAKSIKF